MKIKTIIIPLILLGLIYGVVVSRLSESSVDQVPQAQAEQAADEENRCNGNQGKTIVVRIGERHLWACQDDKDVYDSPVVTGDMNNAATITPVGTYQIYAKQTDRSMSGADAKGTWDVQVDYWMPFLHNQYGSYGFHDANWRSESEFGNVDPYSPNASHGCVEVPLAAMGWLYNWSAIGTQVRVES